MAIVFVSYVNDNLNGIHDTAEASLSSLACTVQGAGREEWIAAFDGIRHLVPGLDGVGAGGTDLDVNLYLVNECFDGESFSISSYDTSAEIGKTAKQTLIASDDLQPIPHLVQAALYDVALDDNLPPEEAAANLHGRVSRQVDLVRRSFYVRTALDAVNQLPGHPSAIFGKGLMADAHVMDEAGAEAHLAALPSLAVLAIERTVREAYPDLQFDVSHITALHAPRRE